MDIIIETCPKCGHDLQDLVIATYPPIPKKECPSCGWYWEGKPEQVIRVPFGNDKRNDYLNVSANNFNSTTTLNSYPYSVGRKINGELESIISHEQLNNIRKNLEKYGYGDACNLLKQGF